MQTIDSEAVIETHLKRGSLSLPETIGQSIANIAPTITPALNIVVVAGIAGVGSWISYLIATIGCVLVGSSIATLAKRHPQTGSYFIYIGRNLGSVPGALAGWMMILAYLCTGIAILAGGTIYINTILAPLNLQLSTGELTIYGLILLAACTYAAFRDVQMSSRAGLGLEIISISIIVAITVLVIAKKGSVVDPHQLDISKLHFGGIMSAMAFAVFSFCGFESSATLAKEAKNPQKAIPYAVIGSVAAVGLFFTIMCYLMVFGCDDNTTQIANSSAPFSDMTKAAHLPWAAVVVYFAASISAFACLMACLTAGSRMIYSMSRYQFLHGSMGKVHHTHKTPYIALFLSAVIVLVAYLAIAPEQGFINAFDIYGTLASYGFIFVYLGVSIVASLDMRKAGLLRPWHIIASIGGAGLMLFVIYSSVIPWPTAPCQYLPQIFVAYVIIGLIWFLYLKSKSPQTLAGIAHDLEG